MAFPEAEAQTIAEYARRTGEPAAEELVGKIRDWLGHPEVVLDRADAWDLGATQAMNAKDSVAVCKEELAPYWEGPAHDSFSLYIEVLERAFDQAREVMSGMSGLMHDAWDTLTETYQAAIEFIGQCAADILNAVGAILGNVEDRFGALRDVARLLADFVRKVIDLANEATEVIAEYSQTGFDLRRQAAHLEVPSAMPPSAGVPGNWDVREQT